MNMKRETEVKAFEVKQYCDACGEELTFTGQRLLSNPPKYVHICNKCGKSFTFSQSYPCIEYKKVKRNTITNVEITDSFNEKLNITSEKHSNENQNNISKKETLTFYLNSTEVEEYKNFVNKHKKCNCSATIGGKISIIFTPTGLGNAKSVKCNVCGEEKEITDVSNW